MNSTKVKGLICIIVAFLSGNLLSASLLHKPDLPSYCNGSPEVILTLEGKGLSKGKFYLTCNGKLYEGNLEAITHQYTEGNNVVYVRPVVIGNEPIEIEGNI